MYLNRFTTGPVELAFTDRHGGVSRAPYDSLNLALSGGDAPEVTAANLSAVVGDFAPGAAVADMSQVHGDAVVHASSTERPEADGLLTDRPGLVLVVRVADCVPVLLAADDGSVIAAVHAGRQGLKLDIAGKAVRRMRAAGAHAISAWVGPRVCGRCYEVPAAMQADVLASVPRAEATSARGTTALDIGAGVIAQLEANGVEVHDVGVCTRESDDLYSHRRDGSSAGRSAGLIWIRPSPRQEGAN